MRESDRETERQRDRVCVCKCVCVCMYVCVCAERDPVTTICLEHMPCKITKILRERERERESSVLCVAQGPQSPTVGRC